MSAELSRVPGSLQIALIAPDAALAEAFVAIVCGAGSLDLRADKIALHFNLQPYSAEGKEAVEKTLAKMDAAVLLADHLDSKSLGRIKAAAQLLAEHFTLPSITLLFRQSGRKEYKLSCPDCGQKLWVSDNDTGRNGRCPQCKRIFALPVQLEYLKKNLEGISRIPIAVGYEAFPDTCRNPILGLVANRVSLSAEGT